MTMLDENRVNELLADAKFVSDFSNANSSAEMIDLLTQKDISVSEEELLMAENMVNNDSELNESDLSEVTGGCWNGPIYWLGYLIGRLIRGATKRM